MTRQRVRVQNLVGGLASRGIVLIEWGDMLYARLGVPAMICVGFFIHDVGG
jgi:tRNA A37 threonylcarbamoyladenosine biosynthesis protein TsaE